MQVLVILFFAFFIYSIFQNSRFGQTRTIAYVSRKGKIIPLEEIYVHALERFKDVNIFNKLGDRFFIRFFAKMHDAFYKHAGRFIRMNFLDERPVDLHDINRKIDQIAVIRVPRTEIVNCDPESVPADIIDEPQAFVLFDHLVTFQDFKMIRPFRYLMISYT